MAKAVRRKVRRIRGVLDSGRAIGQTGAVVRAQIPNPITQRRSSSTHILRGANRRSDGDRPAFSEFVKYVAVPSGIHVDWGALASVVCNQRPDIRAAGKVGAWKTVGGGAGGVVVKTRVPNPIRLIIVIVPDFTIGAVSLLKGTHASVYP